MARYTSQLAVEKVGNRFDLVLIAAQRAKELLSGAKSMIPGDSGPIVTSLKEVESGLYTKKDYINYLVAKQRNTRKS